MNVIAMLFSPVVAPAMSVVVISPMVSVSVPVGTVAVTLVVVTLVQWNSIIKK